MNAGSSSDLPQGNDLDPRHEAIWRLIGRAPLPEPDAWFAARTLARCRSEKHAAISLTRVWRWALGGGLGVCLAVGLLVTQVSPVQSEKVDQHKNVQEAFEIVASMNNADTDSSSSASSWEDSSL